MAFKSNDKTFEKVYDIFDKRDYFNAQGLAKTQIGNFERALQRNDKGAQQILDKFKGDMGKAKEYITQVISDQKKQQAFEDYKAFKTAVDSIQKGKPIYGAVDLVKSRAHNNTQKYTMALYSALRGKKFNNYKDIHADVDSLIGESITEGKKVFKVNPAIGKAKYSISSHDGKKKHKDGSDFFDIETFKNKVDLEKAIKKYTSQGFKMESVTEAKFGYKTSTASYINKHKDEYKVAEKMNKGNEMKFYDDLQAMEDKIGHPKTMLFISNALRGYGVDMYKDPKIKNPADAQEALFLLSK